MRRTIQIIVFLITSCFLQQAVAQNIAVNGKITDKTGTAIAGASVLLKGTTTATSSDADGNYRISIPIRWIR